ncbi:FAD-dependent oxidoreductase [uncultured Rhodoblastus sp.]|uniref:dihydrolipoyl dehydrogenase family protein n=1 Tax=uncultured Rhodoblastus sp. TaxID=543037 RepID=UPI0025FCE835|nr:FAD-dependent oxidoreductase [uncultured Rhodoblastus sp.]
MAERIIADLCIIGGGSAGLSVAAGAAQMGARTVLIEAARMGGDCLNTGCVPSKALLAAANAAQNAREARKFGVFPQGLKVDYALAQKHVRETIDGIAPHDSVERFTGLGCTVIQAWARFTDDRTVEAGGKSVGARRFVIATGSRAAVPSIPGLAETPFFTNENLFENTVLPAHLIVIGAGPIGCEMAQAHRRLGAEVTLIDMGPLLPKDDPDAVAVVRRKFLGEGIALNEGAKIARVEKREGGVAVALFEGADERWIEGSHLLVAAGRKANVENLGLEAAGVKFSGRGVEVDGRLRSSNKRIYVAGDVAGGLQFTHLASYHAGVILRNALFRLPAKAAPKALPWVTYCDPELAQVGLTQEQAAKLHGAAIRVLRAEFADNDRARAEKIREGFLKAIVGKRGAILGCTIVGPDAGDLIQPWVLAMSQGMKIGALASMIAPYPTLGEISKRAAGSFYTPSLFSPRTRKLVRFLGLFG